MAEYRVDITTTGEGAWVADSPVFGTIPEAREYAIGLASRGTVVKYWRVVPTDTPTGEQVDDTERTTPTSRETLITLPSGRVVTYRLGEDTDPICQRLRLRFPAESVKSTPASSKTPPAPPRSKPRP